MSFTLPMAILATLAIVACSSATPASPTPDIGRLSDEAVREMLLLYHTMLQPDFEVAVYNETSGKGYSATVSDALLSKYTGYAGLYLAVQCHNGIQTSPSDFREFAGGFFFETKDGTDAVTVKAKETIKQIISRAQARKQQGLSSIEEPCERPYIAPQSAAEAELAMALIRAYLEPATAANLRRYVPNVLNGYIAQWFSKNDAQDIGFLEWYCGRAAFACD